jgi:hypothetical protein
MVAEGEWPRPSGGPPGAGASSGGGSEFNLGSQALQALERCTASHGECSRRRTEGRGGGALVVWGG